MTDPITFAAVSTAVLAAVSMLGGWLYSMGKTHQRFMDLEKSQVESRIDIEKSFALYNADLTVIRARIDGLENRMTISETDSPHIQRSLDEVKRSLEQMGRKLDDLVSRK